MRKLTQEQIKLLDKLINENPDVYCFDDFKGQAAIKVRQIEKMTDNELAYGQITSRIMDKRMRESYGY